jgi:hypothetical protein
VTKDFKSSEATDVTRYGETGLAKTRWRSSPLQPTGAEADPDLAALVAAWPTLPTAIRAGIAAMVKAASATETGK